VVITFPREDRRPVQEIEIYSTVTPAAPLGVPELPKARAAWDVASCRCYGTRRRMGPVNHELQRWLADQSTVLTTRCTPFAKVQ